MHKKYCSNINNKGLTLIEVLVALVIVGILSGIAYPSYQQFIIRGKLSEATNNLANYRLQLEQYYQDHRSYIAENQACPISNCDTHYFSISCTASKDTFTLLAKSKENAGLGNRHDYVFTINQDGQLNTIKYKGSEIAKNCWLIKGNEC